MCSSLGTASNDLCSAIARLTRRISTNYVDHKGLTCPLASRLIALDKHPGVRPIGVGKVFRIIVAKAVLHITNMDILKAAGDRQLCAGHISGCEAGIHAMMEMQLDERTKAVLPVDASNAFNSLNRQAAMRNIQGLCPPLAKNVVCTYHNAPLFIDGEVVPLQLRRDHSRGSPGHVYLCHCHYPTHLQTPKMSKPHFVCR